MPASPTEPSQPPRRGRARTSAEQRAAAASRVLEGEASVADVARSFGVEPATVRRWVRGAVAARANDTSAEAQGAPAPPQPAPAETISPEPAPPGPTKPERAPAEPLPPEPVPRQPEPTRREPEPPHSNPPQPPRVAEPVGAAMDPDRVVPQVHRLRSTHRYLVVVACWLGMLGVSALMPQPGALRSVLQLGHVLGLVASVGAVAVIDWHGLLWMGRKRDLRETARIAAAVSPLIWAGLALLGVTGVLLKPDLGLPLVRLKMVAILVLAVNGVAASESRQVLRHVPAGMAFTDVPRPLAARLVVTALLSQLAWLTAIVVGLSSQATRS